MSKGVLQLPDAFRIYFWDVNWVDLQRNAGKYREFIVCRLADKGDEGCFAWMKQNFDLTEVAGIVHTSRGVSAKTRAFWQNYANHLRGRSRPGR